jgi:hypothetical protein
MTWMRTQRTISQKAKGPMLVPSSLMKITMSMRSTTTTMPKITSTMERLKTLTMLAGVLEEAKMEEVGASFC